MSTKYFHVCPILLEVGSVIKPGNFGRVIEQYRVGMLGAMAHRELSFEIVRLKHFAHLPSRMQCLFLFGSFEAALNHVHSIAPTNVVYEVELIGDEEPFHADMGLFATNLPSEQYPVLPFFVNLAAVYWQGKTAAPNDTSEFLTLLPVRVVQMHDHRVEPTEVPRND